MVLMMRSDAGSCVVVWVFLDTKFMRDVRDGDGMGSSFIYHEIQRCFVLRNLMSLLISSRLGIRVLFGSCAVCIEGVLDVRMLLLLPSLSNTMNVQA